MKHLRNILAGILSFSLITGAYILYVPFALATVTSFTTSGQWTAPAGVTSVEAQVWGDGGGGGCGGNTAGGAGGGGGAYSETDNVSVTPGNTYVVTVGQGGNGAGGSFCGTAGTAGIGSMFVSSTTVFAQGGQVGANYGGAGGAGGNSGSGYGTIVHSGGTGGTDAGAFDSGSGGGGGAGTTGNGGTGGNDTAGGGGIGGTGTSVGGGNGGAGGDLAAGIAGSTYGGGGGGSAGPYVDNTAIKGARGEVDLTYTAVSSSNTPTVTVTRGVVSQVRGVMIINP